MSQVTTKAANPDNELLIRDLISLLKSNYGESYPAKGAYDLTFWKNHIGARFISLLGYKDQKLAGHIALQPERCNKKHVQLSLPIYDISSHAFIYSFSSQVSEYIERLASRQDWELSYSFVFSKMPLLQQICEDLLNLNTTALWPACLSPKLLAHSQPRDTSATNSHLLISHRIHNLRDDSERCLFVPKRHLGISRYLYRSLDLKRSFRSEFSGDLHTTEGLPADARAIETHSFPRSNIALSFIHPSLLSSTDKLRCSLANTSISSRFLFINLHDPACPAFCRDVENLGFCFGGIMPLLKNRDSIVFFNDTCFSPLDTRDFYSPTAKNLAKYINACRTTEVHQPVVNFGAADFEESQEEI